MNRVCLTDSTKCRAGSDTGTETLDTKLAHQLAGLAHEPMFQVFLDLQKAYDSLDRGRCMEILRGYGIGKKWRA